MIFSLPLFPIRIFERPPRRQVALDGALFRISNPPWRLCAARWADLYWFRPNEQPGKICDRIWWRYRCCPLFWVTSTCVLPTPIT